MPPTTPAKTLQESEQPERSCGCDCARWAHQVSGICRQVVPQADLTLMFFEGDLNPFGVYPRRVCAPCADHIVYARSRAGVSLSRAVQP